jgi:hypothetical protein
MHREWFEPVLAREMGPVAAPAELWQRIEKAQAKAPAPPANELCRSLMLAGATLAMLLAIWAYPARKEIRSTDAGTIRAWVRAQSGVDIPLRSHLPAGLQLSSARMVNGRTEIAYRVRNRQGRLVVGGPKTANTPLTFSGTVDGRVFTLSCTDPGDLKVACALCHIG